MTKFDPLCKTVTVDPHGLVRVDGIPVFRRLVQGGEVLLEFRDRDRLRARAMNRETICVPLDELVTRLYRA